MWRLPTMRGETEAKSLVVAHGVRQVVFAQFVGDETE